MDVSLLIKALGGFFAIMNPFVALPKFLALTASDTPPSSGAPAYGWWSTASS